VADNQQIPDLRAQSAVVLGSFAYGDNVSIEALVRAGAMVPLLESLSHPDKKYLESCARALKAILQNPNVPRDDVFKVNSRLLELFLNL
jgi:hypothetical protein